MNNINQDYKYFSIQISDLLNINLIEQKHFSETLTLYHEFLINYINKNISFKCENNGIIGFIKSQYCQDKYSGIIDLLWVDTEYRRRGIGKKLILMSISEMKKEFIEIKEICLMVSIFNRKAITLYKSLGFKFKNRIKNAYKKNEDALEMSYKCV